MRVGQRSLILVIASFLLMARPLPASAEARSSGYIDESGNPTAEVATAPVTTVPAFGGPPTNCVWKLFTTDDTGVEMYDVNGKRVSSPTGRWYQKICDGGPVQVNGSFVVPGQLPVNPAVLAERARRSVAIADPPMATSPPADRRLYVGVRTWLWVDAGWWKPYTATARASGVSATVTATPTRATWTMGDGVRVVCNSPGTQWRTELPDDRATCSYSYRNSSTGRSGGVFAMAVEVAFDVSWTSSTGRGGTLAAITRSTSKSVQVGEIQAVETA